MTSITVDLRRALSTNLPFVVVLAIVAGGITSSALLPEHWLRGVVVAAVGVLFGGVFRVVLSDRRAGFLRVRSRAFDAACYFTLGGSLIVFGALLPR